MRIACVADVPDELAQEWLQHMRNFDIAHPGCHFEVRGATGASINTVLRSLQIDPPFAHVAVIKKVD